MEGLNHFIGVKQIKAKPMNLFEYRRIKGQPTGEGHKDMEGYYVEYSDNYFSWSPKDVFEKAYLPMQSGNTVCFDEVKNFVKEVNCYTKDVFGKPTTFVEVLLVNGFTMTEQSTCVDPAKYSEEMGKDSCMEKIYNRIWQYLGFTLASALNGIK